MGWSKTSRSTSSSNAESASYIKVDNKDIVRKQQLQIYTIVLNRQELTIAHLIMKQVQQILVTEPTCQGEKLGTTNFEQIFFINKVLVQFFFLTHTAWSEFDIIKYIKNIKQLILRYEPHKASFDGLWIQWGSASTGKTTYIILWRLVFSDITRWCYQIENGLPSTI